MQSDAVASQASDKAITTLRHCDTCVGTVNDLVWTAALQDAAGLSARQLARKKNDNGSHEAILQILTLGSLDQEGGLATGE